MFNQCRCDSRSVGLGWNLLPMWGVMCVLVGSCITRDGCEIPFGDCWPHIRLQVTLEGAPRIGSKSRIAFVPLLEREVKSLQCTQGLVSRSRALPVRGAIEQETKAVRAGQRVYELKVSFPPARWERVSFLVFLDRDGDLTLDADEPWALIPRKPRAFGCSKWVLRVSLKETTHGCGAGDQGSSPSLGRTGKAASGGGPRRK